MSPSCRICALGKTLNIGSEYIEFCAYLFSMINTQSLSPNIVGAKLKTGCMGYNQS